MLLVILLPLLPTLTFAFFVIRYNFMRLMIEQTIVYGAIVVGVLLFHRLVVGDVTDSLGQQYGFDFGVIEGLLIGALVLAYRPFRERISEAMRYLLGSRVADVRLRTRELAVELSRHAEDDPQELLEWFARALALALNVRKSAGWLFDDSGAIRAATAGSMVTQDVAIELLERLESYGATACSRRTSPDTRVLDLLKKCEAGLAVRLSAGSQRGLLLLGHHTSYATLGDEEINAALLLVEQFGITFDNQRLRRQASDSERRALENEKLRTIGLMASCLAHEVKNPLSSIKTITTVMAEQLGNESQHADDLRLVLGEVERLSKTTNDLLGFVRPADSQRRCECLKSTLEGTVQLLSHEARRHGVEIQLLADDDLPQLPADENAIREILLNLLGNSIDAAGEGGEVQVRCQRNGQYAVTQFSDNGPGIAAEVQDRLFEPFATTKATGTGLGLYIVAQRVQELGGDICCESVAGAGTTFVVRLPVEA
jgi:signal transduction histidine kinase